MPDVPETKLKEFFGRAVERWQQSRPSTELPALRVTFAAGIRLASGEDASEQVMNGLRRSMGGCGGGGWSPS